MANEEKAKEVSPPNETGVPLRLRDVNEQLMLSALASQDREEESRVRYRNLVDGLDAIVWEANADPWEYTFVSERAEAILGYSLERWFTEPDFLMGLIPPEDRAQVVFQWKENASAPREFRINFRVVALDGRIVWLAMIARLRQHEHRPAQFRGLLLDIGESVRADLLQTLVTNQTAELLSNEEQLRALATELNLSEHRERTKLATELHDHLAQLLVLGRLKLGQAKRVLGAARECGEFIEQTEDVLTESLAYTRTLVAELSPSVLHQFGLPSALRWLAGNMQRYNLGVALDVPEMLEVSIPEDRGVLLFQSVRELLINIAKHAQTSQASVSLRYKPGALHIEVRDEGSGFELAVDNTTTATSAKFGLFSIRERMKALGGWFQIASTPGIGTTATLILPLESNPELREAKVVLSEPPARPPFFVPSPRAARASKGIRVLLVDDHAMLRQGLRSIVDDYQHLSVVGEASNGLEAIEAVRLLRPDVVVMDINMPQMNGIEATKRIKQEFPQTAVIGLSVHQGSEISQAMEEAGMSAYLMKESAVDELCQMIENAMKQNGKKG